MKIVFLSPSKKIQRMKNLALAIGIFDGVHRGHQRLIQKTMTAAKKMNGTSGVLTFFPHPAQVLDKHFDLSLLVSLSHRLRFIEALGVDVCFVIHFTRKFARITAEAFVEKYLHQLLGARDVFVGRNFHFGKKRQGDSAILRTVARKCGINVHALQSICYEKKIISSSALRILVKSGKLELAEKYLGRPVSVYGRVVHGDARGQRLGIPTANINTGHEILPPVGVYVAEIVYASKVYQGMANIGYRPSFKKNKKKNIEVHIFKFHKSIYNKMIEIRLRKRIRSEKRFFLAEHFLRQIENDKKEAFRYFFRTKKRLMPKVVNS